MHQIPEGSSSRIAYFGMPEIAANMIVLSLDAAPRRQQRPLEAVALGMAQTAVNAPVELATEVLFGVELRRVRRQVEDVDLVTVARATHTRTLRP